MKQDILTELVRRVDSGEQFTINFKQRSLKIGKDIIIDNGNIDDNYCLSFKRKFDFGDNPITALENHYKNYKYSRPTINDRVSYFSCLSAKEMTDEQLILGSDRELCRAKLEWYVLNMLLTGWTWEDIVSDTKHWYWESPSGLVILREWFTCED